MINQFNTPHVAVIILNWETWQDTIECLESVLKSKYQNYSIILIDNGSRNESIEMLIKWANGNLDHKINTSFSHLVFPESIKPIKVTQVSCKNGECRSYSKDVGKNLIHLLCNDENLGFARANNIGIKYAQKVLTSDFFFLLNNDTVIDNMTISNLINPVINDKTVGAAQSVIYYYDKPEKIDSAGGKLYYYLGKGKFNTKMKSDKSTDVGFINGCALLLRNDTIEKVGYLSERFFFGEEDFEYSLRLFKNKIKRICANQSIVYHKISKSSNILLDNQRARKLSISALNRIVDMKEYYPRIYWHIWRYVTIFYYYFGLMLVKYHIGFREANKQFRIIFKNSNRLQDMKKETYLKLFKK